MRSGRRLTPASGLALLLLLAAGPVLAQPREAAGVAARLEAVTDRAEAEEPVTVRFTLTNTTSAPITILKWHTPLEGFNSDMFVVERDGRRVPYVGREVKRGAPGPEDYVTIEPGRSVSADLDLSEGYALAEPGRYQAQYRSEISIPARAADDYRGNREDERGNDREKRWPPLVTRDIASNAVSFDLAEARQAPLMILSPSVVAVTVDQARRRTRAKAAAFQGCSASQQTQVQEAHTRAGQLTAFAILALGGTKEANRASSQRYTTWFGTYTAARYSTVQNNFSKILGALDNETVTYHCDCSDNYYAYVYPNNPYHIYLCQKFWPAPLDGTDSKAGTIIHETSHFYVVADTDDNAYGHAACKNLANSNPAQAVANADSHEYFAENTPPLSMGLEHLALALLTIGLVVAAERLWRTRRT